MNLQLRSFFRSSHKFARNRNASRTRRLNVESLESRSLLAAVPLSSNPAYLGTLGKFTLFKANDGVHGEELWRTDGTPGGTKLVKDINQGKNGSFDRVEYTPADASLNPVVLNGTLYFSAIDGMNGPQLWKSDGTQAGTKMVRVGTGALPRDLVVFKNEVYFFGGASTFEAGIYKTDGTQAGTVLVYHFAFNEQFRGLRAQNGKLYFNAAPQSFEPYVAWQSDGTARGTKRLKGFGQNAVTPFARFNGKDFFVTYDGVVGYGLYRTSGANPTPKLLQSFNSINLDAVSRPIMVGDQMFFTVKIADENQLWKSDGTVHGTQLVSQLNSLPNNYVGNRVTSWASANGLLFFTVSAGYGAGIELWKSDGTKAGTKVVRDIDPSPNSYPLIVSSDGDNVFFMANDGTHGLELWRSNGKAAGTIRVADYHGKPKSQNGISLSPTAAEFFFAGYDEQHGFELWKSNGTAAGTSLLKDIAKRSPASLGLSASTGAISSETGGLSSPTPP